MLAWHSLLTGLVLSSMASAINTTSIPIRAMAAGASVTFGVGSTTGNSYRKNLLDLMTANNMSLSYVGTRQNGDFANNAVEATSGFVISQIASSVHTAVSKFLPNLVLIDAGTNNCNQGGTVPDAGANITAMIDDIFTLSPGSTVILATVLVNSVAKQDACRVDENKQIAALAASMQEAGKKLVLVDMRGPDGPLVTDLADGRHPNDGGYVKMANVWFKGIQEVASKGLLVEPVNVNATAGTAKATEVASVTAAAAAATGPGPVVNASISFGTSLRIPGYEKVFGIGAIDVSLLLLGLSVSFYAMW